VDSESGLVVSSVQRTRSLEAIPTPYERLVELVGIDDLANADALFEQPETEYAVGARERTRERWSQDLASLVGDPAGELPGHCFALFCVRSFERPG
jgi:hypothetical protein